MLNNLKRGQTLVTFSIPDLSMWGTDIMQVQNGVEVMIATVLGDTREQSQERANLFIRAARLVAVD